MDLTPQTIEEFIRLIKSSPVLQQQVREALFPDIESQRPFAALAEAQRKTEIIVQEMMAGFKELQESQRRTDAILQKLLSKTDHLDDNAKQLNMRVGHLEENVQELNTRVRRVEENVQELNTRVGRVEEKVDQLEEKVEQLDTRVGRVEVKIDEAARERQAIKEEAARERQAIKEEAARERQAIRDDLSLVKRRQDDLRGRTYEQQFGNRADGIFGRFLRRGRKARNEVGLLLEEAEENRLISEEEHDQVLASDLIWQGKLKSTKEEIILVVEISWLAEATDVERAVQRANILRAIGLKAYPVVAGIEWVDGLSTEAMSQGVIMVTDMRLDKASWRATVA